MKLTTHLMDKISGKTVSIYAVEGHSYMGKVIDLSEEFVELLIGSKVGGNSSTWNDEKKNIISADKIINIILTGE